MTIKVDKRVYPDSCISKVVYWLSDRYIINRELEGEFESLSINGEIDELSFRKTFFEKLNDFKLRGIIDNETKDIKTILYAKAFGDFEELTEEDVAI